MSIDRAILFRLATSERLERAETDVAEERRRALEADRLRRDNKLLAVVVPATGRRRRLWLP